MPVIADVDDNGRSEVFWGDWTSSFHAPEGSSVAFRATDDEGAGSTSAPFTWLDGQLAKRSLPAEQPSSDQIAFDVGDSVNAWWIEVHLDTEAGVDGGAWRPVDATDWGSWADSFYVPSGLSGAVPRHDPRRCPSHQPTLHVALTQATNMCAREGLQEESPACGNRVLGLPPRRLPGLVLAVATVTVLAGGTLAQPTWEQADPEPVLSDLEGPVDIAVSPEGEIWWNGFYSGNVTRWDPEAGEREVLFHADPLEDPVERGMLGLALAPNVDETGTFYVYYTVPDPEDPEGGTNHLSRIEDGQETRLLEVPAHKRHNGGRIVVDDQGQLFVSTGENTEGYPAQDTESPLGKILHVEPDGSPARDTINGRVYSIGHRNVYGLAYDEANDRLFATENGDRERDEVNLVEPGENYGWPYCQGTVRYNFEEGEPTGDPCPDMYREPLGEFFENDTAAPSGATMFQGDLYWASWNRGEIHRLQQTARGWHDTVVHETGGRINDLTSHEGRIYYANWTAIVRIDDLVDDPAPPENGTGDLADETDDDPPRDVPIVGPSLLLGLLAGAARTRSR